MKFHHHRIMSRTASWGSLALVLVASAAGVASAGIVQLPDLGGGATVIQRAGQTVSIDPATGRIIDPSSDAVRALGLDLVSQYGRTQQPTIVTQSNGRMSAMLPDDYMEVAVLQILPDGTMRVDCVQGMPTLDLLGIGRLASSIIDPAPAAAGR